METVEQTCSMTTAGKWAENVNLLKSERVDFVVFPYCCAVRCEGRAGQGQLCCAGAQWHCDRPSLASLVLRAGVSTPLQSTLARCHNKPLLRKLSFFPIAKRFLWLVVLVVGCGGGEGQKVLCLWLWGDKGQPMSQHCS